MLVSAVAERDSLRVDAELLQSYPPDNASTAILILVDTSDPARQAAVSQAIEHVNDVLELKAAHHVFGLASFDTQLFVLAALGSSVEDVRKAASGLQANGRTTELYRSVLDAIEILGRHETSRKTLLIISDGLAEDYAYGHDDVIAAARKRRIIISSIGLPRSVSQSVALQTLRRLADETGGKYIQADQRDFTVPGDALRLWLEALDSGGVFEVDLGQFAAAGARGAVDLALSLQTNEQSFIVLAPVKFALDSAVENIESSVPAPPAITAALGQPAIEAPLPVVRPVWPWFTALLVALLIVAASLVIFFIRFKRQIVSRFPSVAAKPLAYLIMQDGRATRYTVDKMPWRIGRSHTADLPLSDHSVSRLHAEIRCREDGSLMLNDLESLNGVFVNDNRIESIQLREGDRVDIGDVRMWFTLHDESYANQEATVLVRTHTPV